MIYSDKKQNLNFSVTDQVQHKKLTTFSLDYLNKIFVETETQVKKTTENQSNSSLSLFLAL